MPACSFCHQFGHKIQNCNSNVIKLYEQFVKHNAAFDFYLGLQSTYLKLYLASLNINVLRAISYKNKFSLKNIPHTNRAGKYSHYKEFIQQFILYYLMIPAHKHMELINSVPYREIITYSHSIHGFLIGNNIHTNWTPQNISTILLSTRIFKIDIQIQSVTDENKQYDNCAICFETIVPDNYCELSCHHYFCSSCILQHIKQLYLSYKDYPSCPLCRGEITEITLSETNYDQYVESISNIKKERLSVNVLNYSDEDDFDDFQHFELRIEYLPTIIMAHPRFIEMKHAFFVAFRMYTMLLWIELIINCIQACFKNASSYHNQDTLQR
jgi:hypothetical protein